MLARMSPRRKRSVTFGESRVGIGKFATSSPAPQDAKPNTTEKEERSTD